MELNCYTRGVSGHDDNFGCGKPLQNISPGIAFADLRLTRRARSVPGQKKPYTME